MLPGGEEADYDYRFTCECGCGETVRLNGAEFDQCGAGWADGHKPDVR
jgi:hypothetical protein